MERNIDLQSFQQLDNLEFLARQVVEGFITGLHKSPFHGFSVEFAEHRLYNPGESTKHIDWKLYARSEKLFIKRFEEETNLRTSILIDTSSSMLFPDHKQKQLHSKLSFSALFAAALIYLLRKQRDAVGLTLFSDKIELQTKSKLSSLHSKLLYGELDKLLASDYYHLNKRTHAAEMLHVIADNLHQRSLVVIFSDMLDSDKNEKLFSALQHLRYNKHEVLLFHVTDKKLEEEFKFNNRPYKFIDMETGEQIKFNPNDLRNDYVKGVGDFFNKVKLKCGQYNIDFVSVDISNNNSIIDVLLPYMIKRKKLL